MRSVSWSRIAAGIATAVAVASVLVEGDRWRLAAAAVAAAWVLVRLLLGAYGPARETAAELLAAVDVLVALFAAAAAPAIAVAMFAVVFLHVVVAHRLAGPGPAAAAAVTGAAGAALFSVAAPESLGGVTNAVFAAAALAVAAVAVAWPTVQPDRGGALADPALVAALVADVAEAAAGDGLDQLLDRIEELFGTAAAPAGWVMLLQRRAGDVAVEVERRWGSGGRHDRFALGSREDLVAVLASEEPVAFATAEDEDLRRRRFLEGAGVSACVILPVGGAGSLEGVVAGFRRGRGGVFGPDEADLLARLARFCTAALAIFERSQQVTERGVSLLGTRELAGLTAELRDPVSVVSGFARTLVESDHRFGRLDRRRYLGIIEAQGLSLGRTIDEMAVVVEAASGALVTFPRPVSADEFRSEFAARAGSLGQVSVEAVEEQDVVFEGDLRLLALSAAGLAHLAAARCGSGITVTVAASTTERAARIRVECRGTPGPWEDLEARLERIESGEAAAVWASRASLTLAAAAAVANAHGGGLRLSVNGAGAAFTLSLGPVPAPAQPAHP